MEKFLKGFLIGGFLSLILFVSLSFWAFNHLDKSFTDAVSPQRNDVPEGIVKTYLVNKYLLGFFPSLTMTIPEHTRGLFNGASEIERTSYNAALDAIFKLPEKNNPFELLKKESDGTLSALEKMGIEWRGTIFNSGFFFWGCVILSLGFFLVYLKFCEPIFSFYGFIGGSIKSLFTKRDLVIQPQQQEAMKPEPIPEISPEEKAQIEQERKEKELKKQQEDAERRAIEKARREKEKADEAARMAQEQAIKKKRKKDLLDKI